MSSIEIVIVNWNSGSQLRECIDSIATIEKSHISKIIVVDNGSTDGSATLNKCSVIVDIIRIGKNLGFAKACNLGALHGKSKYMLFLNPDTRLMPESLELVIDFMNSDKANDVGICGIKLIDENGMIQHHCASFPSWRTYFGKATGLDMLYPKLFPTYYLKGFDHLTSCKVDLVIGAFFLVRRDLFSELGGFDERFFVYFEEVDFTLRALKAGWKTWYMANAFSFHKGGGTSEQVKAHRLFYSWRSRIRYAFKNFTYAEASVVAATTLLIEPITRILRGVVRGSNQELKDTALGYKMLLKDLPNIIRSCCGPGNMRLL